MSEGLKSISAPLVDLYKVRLTLPGRNHPVPILRGIDLKIYPGETVSIVGPSGSGKTSLMMIIAGLQQASDGRVMVGGHDMSALGEDDLARFRQKHIGIVFQSFHLIPTMTALENVVVPLEIIGENNAYNKAKELLDRVGLKDRMDHFPSQLSGGEQQRVALARAFAPQPRILLADEPTGNLDADTGRLVVQQLSDLRESFNTTLILVTHNVPLADACERKITLEDGRIADEQARVSGKGVGHAA